MTKRFFDMYPGMESRVKLRNYSSPESKEIWDVGWESSREEILLRWSLLARGLLKVIHPTVQEVAQSKKRTIWTAESSKPESMLSTMNKKKLRLEGWRDCKRDDHF
jgi:ribosome modulation factor